MSDNEQRAGIELRHIYDGVSVWIEADGTLTNRWVDAREAATQTNSVRYRRWKATQEWINAQEPHTWAP